MTMKNSRNRRRNELLTEISEHDRKLAEHRQLSGLHFGTPCFQVCMQLAEVTYSHREAARREYAAVTVGI